MQDLLSLSAADLQLRAELRIAGARCVLRSNSCNVLSALAHWRADTAPSSGVSFEMEIAEDRTLPRAAQRDARFRGLHHLVFADFGGGNVFTLDVLRRKVTGAISQETAGDELFWNSVLVPIVIGVLGPALGIVPVHSACLDLDSKALMLPGASGAGKSTLCAALARLGFAIVSDGWAYVTNDEDGLAVHGISPRVKLLPDSVRYFPELCGFATTETLNGEIAFDLDPQFVFHSEIRRRSRPHWLLFLQRTETPACEFVPFAAEGARAFFENSAERLPSQLSCFAAARSETIKALTERPSWILRSGCDPHKTAEAIGRFCETKWAS